MGKKGVFQDERYLSIMLAGLVIILAVVVFIVIGEMLGGNSSSADNGGSGGTDNVTVSGFDSCKGYCESAAVREAVFDTCVEFLKCDEPGEFIPVDGLCSGLEGCCCVQGF